MVQIGHEKEALELIGLGVEFGGFAETDYGDALRLDARYAGQYDAASGRAFHVARLDQGFQVALARRIDLARADAKLAALVDADDDTVNRTPCGIARSRKKFHKSFIALFFFRAVC